jgi:iron-sulfur cluster repair protein YtfE (RIC family)
MTDEQPARLFAEGEHHELVRGLNRIRDVATGIGRVATPELSVEVIDVLHWLEATFEPHLAWEDRWLYPEIDRRLGTPWATRAARFDHHQIRTLAERLRGDRTRLGEDLHTAHEELRADLFGLAALILAHMEREERFLLPLLDEPPLEPPVEVTGSWAALDELAGSAGRR